jgi:hypothetical protein
MLTLQDHVNNLLTVDQAASELGCTYWQTYYHLRKKKLESVTLPNGKRAITRASVERLKAQLGQE